jgi:Kdo2-lipid IVA lauroyltransferase/acyltransferase
MYYIAFGFLYVLSLLPMSILYFLSDFIYFIIYYVAGYRKKVVLQNLSIAFPEKTEKEKIKIAKKFYHNLTDTFLETIKLISASHDFIRKRFVANFEVLDEIFDKGKRCQVHLGHTFNWEMGNVGMPLGAKHQTIIVYMPFENKTFNRIFLYLRSRTGTIMLAANDMRNAILPYRNTQYLLGLVADQNPGKPENALWIQFFSKPAPFVKAPESGARRGNIPVVFCNLTRRKRGYYEGHFVLIEENPKDTAAGEITKKYVRFIEDAIRANPDNWLWSHRRWKHEWKEEYGEVLK